MSRNGQEVQACTLDDIAGWLEEIKSFKLADESSAGALGNALEDARRGRLDAPPPAMLSILLLGASGAGKSELLNALAGERIAESNYLRPTTTRPTIYAHSDLPPARLFEYGAVLGTLGQSAASYRTHQREPLRQKVVIDAPDIDSFKTEHRALVMQLLPAVDVVLYVVTAHNYKDDTGWQTVLAERGRRAFAFVLNKWDPEGKPRVPAGTPDVDDDLRNLLQRHAGYENPMIYRTSAKYWAGKRTGEDVPPNAPAGDQFPELEEWLSTGLSTNQVAQIQRRRRRVLWGRLAAAVSAAIPPRLDTSPWLQPAAEKLAETQAAGWQLARPALAAQAQSLAASRDDENLPSTPGPFGILWQFTHTAASGLRALGRFRKTSPQAGEAGTASAAPMPQGVQTLLERRFASLEWTAREAGFPAEWISEQWDSQIPEAVPRLAEAAELAGAELVMQNVSGPRRAAGIGVMVAAELLMGAVILTTLWRLATGFFRAQYLDIVFLGNFAALLLCIYVLGHVGVSACLPAGRRRFQRELETRVAAEWDKFAAECLAVLNRFVETAERLRTRGQTLFERCNTETQRLTDEMTTASAPGEIAALFSEAPQETGTEG